ncbi:DNA repair protein [Piromyces finnis]|uniref:DNA repair protein RAD14 n=1 Tax=Piromyces finnis TaxID=1754191 RepID=A0A1Y1V4K6_9FUNG|nr:DNA repair protein [Piromyces finnis]|eukprot:ORX47278.1 DNA repair protein [Piromyces finnis]
MLKNRQIAREKLKKKLKNLKNNNKKEEEIIIVDDDTLNINTGSKENEGDSQPNIIKNIITSTIIDNSQDSDNSRKSRKRKLVYCDYNLSEIVDTKGGFLIEKNDVEEQPEPEKQIKHLRPINLDLDKNPKCKECDSLDIDYNYLDNFNILVCKSCRSKMPEKYSLLTKTECKEDYLLTDSELRDRELLPCWERPNPHKSTWNNMMLFVRYQVEEYAFKKWGSEQGLDDEFDRRETEKRQRKEKKFNEKLKELRRATRTSIWLKNKKKVHVHEFGETAIDKETGDSVRRCKTCGFLEEFEEF